MTTVLVDVVPLETEALIAMVPAAVAAALLVADQGVRNEANADVGMRALLGYPCSSATWLQRLLPKTSNKPLVALEMCGTYTFPATIILNNQRDLPLLNMHLPTWPEKLAMKWIVSASRVASWKSSLHKRDARLHMK